MGDIEYMRRAIRLAAKGEGWCHPNPMVGAVIVKGNRIIGEGWHEKCGENHAERNALSSLTESAAGAVLYVTLEPCCHYGRTGPCTQAVIESGIRKVVVGTTDPNPKVSGKGIATLKDAGIEVVTGFLEKECKALNPVFNKYIVTSLPYVIMKYAMTADGKIATEGGLSKWISGPQSLREVHKLRHACMGIMTGIGTVLADDPLLDCRLRGGRNPVRFVCDRNLRIPLDSRIVKTADLYRTFVCCLPVHDADKEKELRERNIGILTCTSLKELTEKIGAQGIDSILLEGGAVLNGSAVREGIVDEIRAFVSPKIFCGRGRFPVEGEGVEKPDQAFEFDLVSYRRTGADLMLKYVKKLQEKVQENRREGR